MATRLVWITILGYANFTEKEWLYKGTRVTVPSGTWITTQEHLAELSGVSRKQVRNAIKDLIALESIRANQRANRYTEICIVNWPIYQSNEMQEGQPKGQERANQGPTKGQDVIRKEGKKERKEQIPSPRSLPESAIWPSPLALFLKYNREATDNCPAITSVSPGRMKKAQEYLAMFPDEAWWTRTFRQYHLSRFLNGTEERTNGHKGFQPDLDWLLSKGKTDGIENCVKVHDGRYTDG
jgi:hypothetical protein